MFDHLVELLTQTEQDFFAAVAQHRDQRCAGSRQALDAARARLDAAKAEAHRALWASQGDPSARA